MLTIGDLLAYCLVVLGAFMVFWNALLIWLLVGIFLLFIISTYSYIMFFVYRNFDYLFYAIGITCINSVVWSVTWFGWLKEYV